MNRNLERVLILAAGLALGAIGTNFVLRKKYEDLVDSELTSLRETYREKAITKQQIDEVAKEYKTDAKGEKPTNIKNFKRPETEKIDYNKLSTAGHVSKEIEDLKANYVPKSERIDKDLPVYPIEMHEYLDTYVDYEKIELTYYAADDVLADEDDEPIDDVLYYLGVVECQTLFDVDDDDPDTAYVRNNGMSTDFLINRSAKAHEGVVSR